MKSLPQLMLDHCPNMMLLVRPDDLGIAVVNRVASQVLGYSEERLLGMCITDIESSLQDVFYWEEVRNGQYDAIDAQEGQYQCADGALLTVAKSIHVIHHEGAPLLLVQARDIQHQQQVEDALEQTLSQLQATLESTGNGILVLDWHGKITSMNRLCSAMWRIPEELLLAGNDEAILGFLSAQVLEADVCRGRLREVLDRGEAEDLFRLTDGRVFECKSRPQYLGERIIGRVFGYTDITERKLAEEALRQSRDRLEERVLERTADLRLANATLQTEKARQQDLIGKLGEAQSQLLQSEKMASIGVLAAGVAHEINNPVGFVNSNLGSLQRYTRDLFRLLDAYQEREACLAPADSEHMRRLKLEIDADFLREDLDSLLAESLDGLDRVKRIVQDMKEFSHVDGGGRQQADLEAGLDSTLNVVWHEIKYKAEVVKEYGAPPAIECYPSQLNQVFMNLLINAAHAIEEHGRITVRTGHDGANVWVEIEDTGKGIAPEHLSRIFEPFFTTKPIGQGTGLGLSLSYGIVQKHGGAIEVRSEVGAGTVFRVVLPTHPPAAADDAPQRT
ncbi:ATP-binding protein [Pseudoduganella namucuonensis]|uniref:histidine kinase n=1 Tax=Pseudoduganella namucuonensis TaxID=1035707 RepID=A0A1I7IKN2_9BURK|nr:ATP-binding protein [Pseudoduganella namucuonensis]SFU73472.1 PAS domain S-box-containing protein [Pseudoduganella namucuonensis]